MYAFQETSKKQQEMTDLTFMLLNRGWNAEPNAPEPKVEIRNSSLELFFLLNPFIYAASEGDVGRLTFGSVKAWRLGPPNHDGWEKEGRYGQLAPRWGQFYEIVGEDMAALLDRPKDWHEVLPLLDNGMRHFLFYMRDETFECLALGWRFDTRSRSDGKWTLWETSAGTH